MPRDTAGNYTLPAGNPVASGEIISASWANSTMNDLGQSLSASLDRYGRGGMLAPFQFTDGTESAPGATWSNEPTTGLYRAAYGDLRFTLTGTDVQRWTSANSYLWRNSQWEEILTQTGGGGDTTINNLVVTDSFTSPGIDDNATSTAITIDANENVGIGTEVASAPLHVSSTASPTFRLDNPSGLVRFNMYDAANFVSQVAGSDANGLELSAVGARPISLYNNSQERMRIDAAGHVGIGTNAPSALLHCAETASGLTARFSNETDQTLDIGTVAGAGAAGSVYLDNPNSGNMQFRIGGTERLRITAAGVTQVTGGFEAAQPGAGFGAFAVGLNAGLTSQGISATALGHAAGNDAQGNYATAIGRETGRTNQGMSASAVGHGAGAITQGDYATAMGYSAGYTGQGASAVAVGNSAGQTNQTTGAVAVGYESGLTTQGESAVAVGRNSGQTSQGANAVAVGRDAGFTGQGSLATAVGYYAGKEAQGTGAVAVGREAGQTRQGETAIALGYASGYVDQGDNSIAIGNRAGQTNQGANGIIISSTGVAGTSSQPNHIVLQSGATQYLYYNGTNLWEFAGGNVTVPNDNLLVGTTSPNSSSAKVQVAGSISVSGYLFRADNCGFAFGTNIIYPVGSSNSLSNGSVDLGASGNKFKDAYLSGTVKALRLNADHVIQDGAPVIDAKGLINTLSTLRQATMDETQDIRESLRLAIDELIDGFEQEIATMPAPEVSTKA